MIQIPGYIKFLTFFLIVFTLSSGCSPAKPSTIPALPVETEPFQVNPEVTEDSPSVTVVPDTIQIETEVPASTPSPEAQDVSTKPWYSLSASLDYGNHILQVAEEILYFNNTNSEFPDIVLVVEPNRYQGTFRLISLSVNGTPINSPDLESNRMVIPLESTLLPGEKIQINISYELFLPSPQPSPEIRPIPFGYTSRQTNLVDWYPYIPPYDPVEGWLVHNPWFYGEHQVYEISDFEVSIQLLDDRDDLVIAASTPGQQEGDHFNFKHLDARNFVWSVSHTYDVLSEQVGNVLVVGYSFPFDRVAAEAVLETTVKSLSLYQELFGPYHRDTLSVVEADFLDGMEFDGLYFLSYGFYNSYNGSPSDYLIAIAAHETAHQWWYAQVGNDQAIEPWLDEAFCTYSERLYYEHDNPESLDWWWAYRINYYQPEGYINRAIYETNGYLDYRNSIYLNGAKFLEDLRILIGDEIFFSFLSGYTAYLNSQISTSDKFFELLGQFSNQDISGLKSSYFK